MLAPEGIEQLLFAPHWYTDVYPWMFQYDPVPRNFTVDEIQFRDLTDGILDTIELAQFSLGNVPVISANSALLQSERHRAGHRPGLHRARPHHHNYYDAMEEQLVCRTIWCYSPENTFKWGEGWNNEDFSVLGPEMAPRATDAYVRATPRFTSGKLLSYNYNSPLDYYEEQPGRPRRSASSRWKWVDWKPMPRRKSGFRAEIPRRFLRPYLRRQMPLRPGPQILYWYPFDDDPNVRHTIRLRPPWDDYGDLDWITTSMTTRPWKGGSDEDPAMHLILLSLTILLAASPVAAQETAEDSPVDGLLGLSINLEFKNFFLWQNDSDFDRTDPLYDENGQSVGYFATALTPTMAWQPIDEVLLRYKVQIGENLWSRNDVLERDPTAEDIPTLQHKEIWGAVTLPYDFYVGAGYSSSRIPRPFPQARIGCLQPHLQSL
jgi:hypothetical protein